MAKLARKILVVRFRRESVHLEGSTTSYVRTDKVGRHHAYTAIERPEGVELSKEGLPTVLVPWAMVQLVEYSDV